VTTDDDLARQLAWVAQHLDTKGYAFAGPVRIAARRLATGAPADGCPGCGGPVEQPPAGRRRKWCSEACRSRTRRRNRT
jgi:hypothetical protein